MVKKAKKKPLRSCWDVSVLKVRRRSRKTGALEIVSEIATGPGLLASVMAVAYLPGVAIRSMLSLLEPRASAPVTAELKSASPRPTTRPRSFPSNQTEKIKEDKLSHARSLSKKTFGRPTVYKAIANRILGNLSYDKSFPFAYMQILSGNERVARFLFDDRLSVDDEDFKALREVLFLKVGEVGDPEIACAALMPIIESTAIRFEARLRIEADEADLVEWAKKLALGASGVKP